MSADSILERTMSVPCDYEAFDAAFDKWYGPVAEHETTKYIMRAAFKEAFYKGVFAALNHHADVLKRPV